jgi:hypothetical protein
LTTAAELGSMFDAEVVEVKEDSTVVLDRDPDAPYMNLYK